MADNAEIFSGFNFLQITQTTAKLKIKCDAKKNELLCDPFVCYPILATTQLGLLL